jgi:hypothetical protein
MRKDILLRTLCPTDTSELSVLTIQLIQDWMPLRFEDVQTQDKSVQACSFRNKNRKA